MKRLLVTGASGLVGGHLIQHARGLWEIFGTHYKHETSFDYADMHFVSLTDEQSIKSLLQSIRPHVIIHTAAWTDVDGCEQNQDLAYQINAKSTEIIAREAAKIDARMIYLSSDMVFDGKKGMYKESDPPNPINFYGKTKLAGEDIVVQTVQSSVVARVALVYGKPVRDGNSFSERILQKVNQGVEVLLYTNQYRSPIWVNNLSEALLELAEHSFCGILHLGGDDRIDRYHFGLFLAENANFPSNLLHPVSMMDSQPNAPRPMDASFCIRQAHKLLKTRLLGYREGIIKLYQGAMS